jgi:DNA-binding SARP family transcriptional activator
MCRAYGGHSVQVRLRHRLADAVRLQRGDLDSQRFEELLGEGRRAIAEGNPRAAAASLEQALALWRGPPLADFADERFAQAEIARLDDLRLGALEERIESDLALGQHAALVGELRRLTAEHPLRERLREQLMLALYRCGRQAEALGAYSEARATLVEELAGNDRRFDFGPS